MDLATKGELTKIVREKEKENKLVIYAVDELQVYDVDEFIQQPTESMLYDLNRDKATILTLLDDKWINDYAVMLVIARLKKFYDKNNE